MKSPFFKTIVLAGAIAALWNCSSDDAAALTNANSALVSTQVATDSWLLEDQGLLITPSAAGFAVTTTDGTPVGVYDPATGSILDANGTQIITSLDLTQLPKVTTEGTIVYPDGTTTDLNGTAIDPTASTETPSAGTTDNGNGTVATSATSTVTPGNTQVTSSASNANTQITSSTNGNTDGTPIGVTSSASNGNTQVTSSASNGNAQAASSTSNDSGNQQATAAVTVTGNLTQTVSKGSSISTIVFNNVTSAPDRGWNIYFVTGQFDENAKTYTLSGSVPDYLSDGTSLSDKYTFSDGSSFTFTLTIGAGSSQQVASSTSQQTWTASSSSQQTWTASSSSTQTWTASSSSQQVASSSSTAVSGSTELVYVSGGASGSGWATRYWDCCKPSCSWESNTSYLAKQCTVNGSTISDANSSSVCDGGSAATCTSQIPIIVNDNLAYAFAAVPASNGGACGKCFALTFDGTGKYETKANHQAIKGKVLVVMASNVGTDVSQGQFDIMIPGGGVGIFNGCSNMPGWQTGSMGAKYGGLLSDCESSVGYDGDLLTLRKNCLVQKCNSVFSGDAVAKEGCLFLANWMQAAGNPNHTYKEVECPAALKAQY